MAQKRERQAPIEIAPEDFRSLGYKVVDRIADFLASLPERPTAPNSTPGRLRALLGDGPVPEGGADPAQILERAADLLFENSTFNGHPRFWGYITSSAAPIGALAEMIAATVNANVGGWQIGPMATEIEAQTVRWIAQMIGYPDDCGGILVSGGNVANFVPFVAARRAKAGWDLRAGGMNVDESRRLKVYVSKETHTWIQKAADLFGLGTDAICWVETDDEYRMDTAALRRHIKADREAGYAPFMVVGTAGSTAVGAIDPLHEIAALCQEQDLWFHVDGAYGAFAATLPDAHPELSAMAQVDSIALDPHKWLYSALEAGCVLVRDEKLLIDAFAYHPDYYHFDEEVEREINYFEYGLQNSRGFRGLKVWLALQQVGRSGYQKMIAEDIRLARALYDLADAHPELQACTHSLSVTTFRYVPRDLQTGAQEAEAALNRLNEALLSRLNKSGEAFISNAMLNGKFALRICVVNFRTSIEDIQALPEIVTRIGAQVYEALET